MAVAWSARAGAGGAGAGAVSFHRAAHPSSPPRVPRASATSHTEGGRETSRSALPCLLVIVFLPSSLADSTTTTLSPSLLFPTQHRTTPLSLSPCPSRSLISPIKAKEPRSEQEKKGKEKEKEKEKEKKRLASPRLLLGLRPASHLTSPPSAQASGKRSKRAWQRYGNGTRVPSISHTLLPTIPFRIEWVIHRSSSYCSLLCLACDATPLARTSRVCVAWRAAAAGR